MLTHQPKSGNLKLLKDRILSKLTGTVLLLAVFNLTNAMLQQDMEDGVASEGSAQVEVRAVFIKCSKEFSDLKDSSEVDNDSDIGRFEREELFRHDALHNCLKKLALTVRLSSSPSDGGSEEYIPVEHVLEGPGRRRVRLLDPYVLRLRRAAPLQAYALHHVDRILGVLTKQDSRLAKVVSDNDKLAESISRQQRDTKHQPGDDWMSRMEAAASLISLDHDSAHSSFSVRLRENVDPAFSSLNSSINHSLNESKDCGLKLFTDLTAPTSFTTTTTKSPVKINREKKDTCVNNILQRRRSKRREHNIIIEDSLDDDKTPIWMLKDQADALNIAHEHSTRRERPNEVKIDGGHPKSFPRSDTSSADTDRNKPEEDANKRKSNEKEKSDSEIEEDFVLYAIHDPELWHTVQVQLYKKYNDEDGKIVWDDITKGITANVGLTSPGWAGEDLSIRYKPLDWVGPGDFVLPKKTRLCLLVPRDFDKSSRESEFNFMVVPVEDIIGGDDILKKRTANYSEKNGPTEFEKPKRVLIRTSRAWIRNKADRLAIVQRGSLEYLTVPHQMRHRSQIELEARADDNQLVRVGNSGRISTIVSDATRRSRTVITLQATNTGLAAAKFRAVAKNCAPEISGLINEKSIDSTTTERILIPPHHTKRIKLELPIELPVNTSICSISLVNDEDFAVAMRDVAIKRDDRCFCVWYCDCVCLTDDPKLLCREMAELRMTAAGLQRRDRPRRSRSVPRQCEGDIWDLIGVPFGLMIFLLFLGFLKASIGLVIAPLGMFGLDKVVQLPVPLQNYQELWLRSRDVEYDREGWPVHPDTKKRTVHAIAWPVEFGLNIIFFIMLPCLIFREACTDIKKICFCKWSDKGSDTDLDSPSVFSAVQDIRQMTSAPHRTRAPRWMTTHAEKLSTDLWNSAFTPYENKCETIKPLLLKSTYQPPSKVDEASSFTDSEQDDTDYVLTQMQKSRESLAVSLRSF